MNKHVARHRRDLMANSFVRKSQGLQPQRCANRIKSQSNQRSEKRVAGCERRSSGRMVGHTNVI
jgi:hypothetical protein